MLKKVMIGICTLLVCAGAVVAGPGAARAQEVPQPPDTGTHVWSDHIWFHGHGSISDTDGDNGIDVIGDGGAFAFTTDSVAGEPVADCMSDAAELGEPIGSEVGPCWVSGSGTFTNQICGTGVASGNAVVTGPEPGTASFAIWFNAGVGVIEGTWFDSTEGSAEPFTGTVHLGPAPGDVPGGDDCAHAFTITAFIDAFEPPSGS